MFKRQPPGMSSPVEQSPAGSHQQQLQGLNLDFLQVLLTAQATDSSNTSRPGLRLPETQARTLSRCDATALQRMSACDFSLYSLNLHRVDEWLHLAEQSAQAASTQRNCGLSTNTAPDLLASLVANFMNCAVFFAWHLAQQDVQAARFMLGMSGETASVLRTMDLWQCRHIGQRYSKLLSPRWQHNRYFWPDLLRYGLSGELDHFKFAQLLGTQLVAQDLEPSAIARLTSIDPD